MIGATFTCAYLWEVCRGYNLDQVLVVKGKDFAGNVLNSWVDQVKTIFSRVDVPDDAVVYVDEGILGHLHAGEQSVE